MRIVLSSTLTLLVGMGAALAFPTAEVPPLRRHTAKLKTAAPEEIVAKATIVMTQDGKERSLQTGTKYQRLMCCRSLLPSRCSALARFPTSKQRNSGRS